MNIYPLICELLQLAPNPNNGSRDNYQDMLATTSHTTQSAITERLDASTEQTRAETAPPPKLEEHDTSKTSSPEGRVVRTLSLLVMSLSIVSLLLFVTVLYYCGKYGLCKNGLCGEQEHERSHTGFISLVNDFDVEDDSDEV